MKNSSGAITDLSSLKRYRAGVEHLDGYCQGTMQQSKAGGYVLLHEVQELLARRTPVADGAALDLPALDEHRIIELWNSTESGGVMGRYIRFANAIAREAISHYLRKQAGQVGEQPTKGESNAGA